MRNIVPEKLEAGRIRSGPYGSTAAYGLTGAFFVMGPTGAELKIVASDGEGWEHVSVSTDRRPPNWAEMCFVKDLFWADDELVIQFHPPKDEYVNCHPHCLHLWRPTNAEVPTPPSSLVGPKVNT
jgi:hypothetical protein